MGKRDNTLQHKPFGMTHPTWQRPDCFFYDNAQDAARAIVKTYGENSDHVVVGVVMPPAKPTARPAHPDTMIGRR